MKPTASPTVDLDALVDEVRSVLTDDILKPRIRRRAGRLPSTGHCYAASEAIYHLLGGKAAGWTPVRMRLGADVHWWLRGPDGVIVDPTADQFDVPVPYEQGRGGGFLTGEPSWRAATIIERVSDRRLRLLVASVGLSGSMSEAA